ncbi:unnamed protein product [Ectocarpus fasciculatus]
MMISARLQRGRMNARARGVCEGNFDVFGRRQQYNKVEPSENERPMRHCLQRLSSVRRPKTIERCLVELMPKKNQKQTNSSGGGCSVPICAQRIDRHYNGHRHYSEQGYLSRFKY